MAAGTAETRAAKFFRLASARVKRAVKAILETAMASGSIRRAQRCRCPCPSGLPPCGRIFSLIAFSRNAASYFSRPRAPQPTRDIHNRVLICPLADIIGQAKQPVQVEGLCDPSRPSKKSDYRPRVTRTVTCDAGRSARLGHLGMAVARYVFMA
jgi:hypothetical protein